jgi:uncharacterized cupin superfamily protein
LRTPRGEEVLDPGHAEVFLRGPGGAHLIRNVGEDPARVLMLSTLSEVGVSPYPDDYWEGEG